jgi:hypothetical protein
MIFGGSSYENITDYSGSTIIKTTLDDLWVFNIRTDTWI